MQHFSLTGCWNLRKPRYSFATWFFALAFEIYLFVLVCIKAYKKHSAVGSFMGLFKVMFRDAVVWFVFIGVLIGWNAFSWLCSSVSGDFYSRTSLHVLTIFVRGNSLVIS